MKTRIKEANLCLLQSFEAITKSALLTIVYPAIEDALTCQKVTIEIVPKCNFQGQEPDMVHVTITAVENESAENSVTK